MDDEGLANGPALIRPNPKAARGGHRATATKLIADIQVEMAKDDGGSKIKLGVFLKKTG